jgi:hypothetical protein
LLCEGLQPVGTKDPVVVPKIRGRDDQTLRAGLVLILSARRASYSVYGLDKKEELFVNIQGRNVYFNMSSAAILCPVFSRGGVARK